MIRNLHISVIKMQHEREKLRAERMQNEREKLLYSYSFI
jgi:hypothetical protein